MSVAQIILIVLEAVVSLALILVVLFQSGKEAGLSGALAGNSETYMGKGKGANLDKVLATATKWVALAWVVLTLALNFV
jgi:preprotein translocase subunit SecG